MSLDPSLAASEPERIRHCTTCLAIYRSDFPRCPIDGGPIATSIEDPMRGVVIEHYQIDEIIGIGSSGRVYLAHHSRLAQRRFALKILFGDLAATAPARIRFTHEAESASRLAHPNLVSVVDFGRTPSGLLYLVMDYIDGPTLASVIARDGAMAQERAVRMSLQLCRGLAHAHDIGLIHRDFKPDNILISSDANGEIPRIVDFGIALSAGSDGDPRLTAMGVTLGTPAYAAPEQASDGEIDHRADLFALGVTMYEMLTGRLPFDGSLVEMMRLNATTDAPAMAERVRGLSVTAPLQYLVSKLMARDPAQRYQTAREVVDALTELPRRPGASVRPSSTMLPTFPGSIATPTPRARTAMSAVIPGPRTPVSGVTSTPLPNDLRPSSPALVARRSAPVLGARPSAPILTSRASTPLMGPLLVPSSTPVRMQTASAVEAADTTSRVYRIELAPLVTPVPPRNPSKLTLILAVAAAAVLSAAAVLGYQHFTGHHGVHPAPAITTPLPVMLPDASGDELPESGDELPESGNESVRHQPTQAPPVESVPPVAPPVAPTVAPPVAPIDEVPISAPIVQSNRDDTVVGRPQRPPRKRWKARPPSREVQPSSARAQ